MPGLIINGKEVLVPGLDVKNWHDNPKLRRSPEDGKLRKSKWIKQVILHSTGGIPGGSDMRPQVLKPGAGSNLNKDLTVAEYWSTSKAQAGAHLIIDVDGSVACIADLATESMFHAGIVNDTSIGIELYQMHADAGIYQATIDTAVVLCNFLSEVFGVQRQVHLPYLKGPMARLERGGKDCVGFFGHRDVTNNRGQGDPGDFIMDALLSTGYDIFNFEKNEDLDIWKRRQTWLNSQGQKVDVDGVPGPNTFAASKAAGVIKGLWVLGLPHVDPAPIPTPQPEPTPVPTPEPTPTLPLPVEPDDSLHKLELTQEEIKILKKLLKAMTE